MRVDHSVVVGGENGAAGRVDSGMWHSKVV